MSLPLPSVEVVRRLHGFGDELIGLGFRCGGDVVE